MKVKAAAKINLMLDILKRLDNGYHFLFMIMQSVDLYDVINVEKNSNNEIFIKCDTEGVPCNEKNIAYKCAKAFFDALFADTDTARGISLRIHIDHKDLFIGFVCYLSGNINARGCFTYSAFLVSKRYYFCHIMFSFGFLCVYIISQRHCFCNSFLKNI